MWRLRAQVVVLAVTAAVSWWPQRANATEGDLVTSRAVLEDPTAALTIAEVVGRPFEPAGATLAKGVTRSAWWVRVTVKAPPSGGELVLSIRPTFLNDVRLYEAGPGAPETWRARVTGNRHPFESRDRLRASLGFVVQVAAPEQVFYLRLQTQSALMLNVEALSAQQVEQHDDAADLLAAVFVTSMVALLLWALASFITSRQRLVGLFALNQATYTLFGVAITGYLAPFVPAAHPALGDHATAVLYCASAFTTFLFCKELFLPYEPPPSLRRVLTVLPWAFPVQLAALALGQSHVAVVLNVMLVRLMWWLFVVVAFTLRREQAPSRRLLQAVFVSLAVVYTVFWFLRGGPEGFLLGTKVLVASGLLMGTLFAMILGARTRRLEQEAQKAAVELAARTEFLSVISHELRTPLNALVGFASLARQATDPARTEAHLAVLEQSSQSLLTLVNDVLDLAKSQAGRTELEAAPFELRETLRRVEGLHQLLAQKKGLRFTVTADPDVPAWVRGDALRLRQVLDNLLSNAVKFTARGEVSLSVSVGARGLRFEVRDTGIGISPEHHARLFEPFRQVDASTTRQFGGTGLGLAIVRDLVTLMGGTIGLTSQVGGGTCFVVELPLSATEAPRPAAPAAVPATRPPLRVLVVDDQALNRQYLEALLVGWGQRVTLAESGEAALAAFEAARFDVVLLDVRMAVLDGPEVARRWRRLELERGLSPARLIAVTADADDPGARRACLDAGMDAVLAKPVDVAALAALVAASPPPGSTPVTVPEPAPAAAGLELKALELDPARAAVFKAMLRQDIEAELRALEAALHREDRPALGEAAHGLKGLLKHLVDPGPAALAAALQAGAPSMPAAQVRAVMAQLREHRSLS